MNLELGRWGEPAGAGELGLAQWLVSRWCPEAVSLRGWGRAGGLGLEAGPAVSMRISGRTRGAPGPEQEVLGAVTSEEWVRLL